MVQLNLLDPEIVFTGDQFHRITRWLCDRIGGCVTGELARYGAEKRSQWVTNNLRLGDRPTGRDFEMLANWTAIEALADVRTTSAEELRRQFDPMPGQHFVYCGLASGTQRGHWRVVEFHADAHRELGLRVVGSPYLVLRAGSQQQSREPLSPRWSRLQNALGRRVIEQLRDLHVVIFGASRNGSIVARELAALGVGHLTLVDPDVLEIHNFDAMLGGDIQDCGRNKVIALSEELVRFNDCLQVTRLPYTATDRRVITAAKTADVLVTAVDNGTPVLVASKLANRWNKLHLDIGTSVQHAAEGGLQITGDVRLFLPREACAMCVGGVADLRQAQIDLQLPAGVRPFRVQRDFRVERAGSLVTINAIAVSVGVQMLLDLFRNQLRHSTWSRLELHPTKGVNSATSTVFRSETCKNCG